MEKDKLGSGNRFKKLANKMAREGVEDPDAVAASAGIKKYGKRKMTAMAQMGKARHKKHLA